MREEEISCGVLLFGTCPVVIVVIVVTSSLW